MRLPRLIGIAVLAPMLSACVSNEPMSQAEYDYKMRRTMEILQGWRATQPQAPAIQPSGIVHCRQYYVGNMLKTECM